jgi:excinuclease UvrABC ATPase subunit
VFELLPLGGSDGEAGGEIVAAGRPEEVARSDGKSHDAQENQAHP